MARAIAALVAALGIAACNAAVGDPSGSPAEAPAPVDAGTPGGEEEDDGSGSPDAAPVERELSQSASEEIAPQTGIACIEQDDTTDPPTPVEHRENSYYRLFDLEALGVVGRLDVEEVSFGIESASSPEGSQPASLVLHALSVDDFKVAQLTQLASVSLTIPNQGAGITTVPVAVSVPPGSKLAVELLVPEGDGTGRLFFIGANAAGQTGPTYLRAPACGVVEPTDMADIGFPDVHFVLTVSGTEY
ncbi:MAG TPA: hypothetical protein VKZ63_21090 [Kofleriaceae bacterium]|nr:hypothetical protein [Kofleriaceae bacterium]